MKYSGGQRRHHQGKSNHNATASRRRALGGEKEPAASKLGLPSSWSVSSLAALAAGVTHLRQKNDPPRPNLLLPTAIVLNLKGINYENLQPRLRLFSCTLAPSLALLAAGLLTAARSVGQGFPNAATGKPAKARVRCQGLRHSCGVHDWLCRLEGHGQHNGDSKIRREGKRRRSQVRGRSINLNSTGLTPTGHRPLKSPDFLTRKMAATLRSRISSPTRRTKR